ncbi:unnamed protein product [Cochlearia groenlandica]
MVAADSITDSELFHGSPTISSDLARKRKANWLLKLMRWKINARRRQCEDDKGSRTKSSRDKRADRKTTSSSNNRFSHRQAWNFVHGQGSYDDETGLRRTPSASSSPTSVLKSKDSGGSNKSGEGCFCCSNQVAEEEEEDFGDAYENFDGFSALSLSDNEDSKGSSLHEATDPEQEEEDEGSKLKTSQTKTSTPEKLFCNDKSKQDSSSQEAIHNNNRRKREKKEPEKQECDEKSECPVCSEEMDATDLSFSPCPCGFRLCLFCHNKINENDGRCPSCRSKYNQTSNDSGEVSFGRGKLSLSSSFRGLDTA